MARVGQAYSEPSTSNPVGRDVNQAMESRIRVEIERLANMRDFATTTLRRLEQCINRLVGSEPAETDKKPESREASSAIQALQWNITDLSEVVASINSQIDRMSDD